jgi:WD40 repeat protein
VVDGTSHQVDRMYIASGPPGYTPPDAIIAGGPITLYGRRFYELYERGDAAVIAIARAGRTVATLDSKQQVVIWDLDARRGRMLAQEIAKMALSSDGTRVITVGADKLVKRWSLVTNTSETIGGPISDVSAVTCSHDGAITAVVTNGNVVVLPARVLLESPDDHLLAAAISPDDQTVVAGGDGRELHIWPIATRVRRSLQGATASITKVQFLPDGRVAAASRDGSIELWQLAGGTATTLAGHTGEIRSIELAGDTVVTTSADRTARIWDLVAGTSRVLPGPDQYAALTGDGHVMAVDTMNTVYWFNDELPTDEAGLRSWIARWKATGNPTR